ncbi:MAG: hypothetical protein K940chlam6_00661 [Chlamydiae bacterium]|nr:hypothetical protein [Chlamydiota bacterium]
MKKKSKLLFILSFFAFFIFFTKSEAISMQIEIPEPDATVHEIMDDTIATLTKKYNLHPCGIGMNGKFEYLEISFQIRKNLNRDEIRAILMDCGKEFLENINSCKMIRPFLKDYPFSSKNIGIVLFIRNETNNDIFHPEICCASIRRSVVSFHTKSEENQFRYKETYEESYEEALALLEKTKDPAEIAKTKNPE